MQAEDRIGLNVLLLQPCRVQAVGGENLPSGNVRGISVVHFSQAKFSFITRGFTVLAFTTVPRMDTSLSVFDIK